jgi:GntR family transcriptional regulator
MIGTEPEIILSGRAPAHREIHDQVHELIALGILHPGEELPTERAVAVGLGVNPQVVRRAYRALQHCGVLYREGGICRVGRQVAAGKEHHALRAMCADFLERAVGQGFAVREILSTLHGLLQRRSAS